MLASLQREFEVSESKVHELTKKHPPWFMLDIHPIRHAKKISEEEQGDGNEMEEGTKEKRPRFQKLLRVCFPKRRTLR
jgi:hypothetical protein